MSLTANSICRSCPPPSGDNILYLKHLDQLVWAFGMHENECSLDKSVGKNPLGINKTRRENNIKMRFKEIRCKDVDWICLANFFMQRHLLVGHDVFVIEASRSLSVRHITLGMTPLER